MVSDSEGRRAQAAARLRTAEGESEEIGSLREGSLGLDLRCSIIIKKNPIVFY